MWCSTTSTPYSRSRPSSRARSSAWTPGLASYTLNTKSRPSFALDLIESVRPRIDNFGLDLLQRRTFWKAEFVETDDGHCRLRPPLTHELAETLPMWAKELAPMAERIAHLYGDALGGKYVASTPLTQENSRAARAIVKARQKMASAIASSSVKAQHPASTIAGKKSDCLDCGSPVTNHRHVRCAACIAADPQQTPEIRGRRGVAIASRKRALKNWEEKNGAPAHDAEILLSGNSSRPEERQTG